MLVATAVAVVAVVVLRAVGQRSPQNDSVAASPVPIVRKPSPPTPDANPAPPSIPGAGTWASDRQAGAVTAMRVAFEQTRDLRDFVDRALARPTDGGVFYAARALAACKSLNQVAGSPRALRPRSGTDEQVVASDAAIAREVERCHGLGDDRSQTAVDVAMRSGAALGDPMLGTIQRERDARGASTRPSFDAAAAMVQRAIAIGDPNFFV